MSTTVRSGPAPQGTIVSNRRDKPDDTLLVRPAVGASGSSGIAQYSRSREEETVQALMDLSLPRFSRLEDGGLPRNQIVAYNRTAPFIPSVSAG